MRRFTLFGKRGTIGCFRKSLGMKILFSSSLLTQYIRLMLMGLKIKRSVEVEKAAVIWNMSMKGMSMVDTRRSLNGVIDGIT